MSLNLKYNIKLIAVEHNWTPDRIKLFDLLIMNTNIIGNTKVKIVVTINNVDNTEVNFSWLKSNDLDGDQISYLFSAWYEIIGENGNLEVVNIDTTILSTHYSIGYDVLIDRLNDYRSPKGKLIWTVTDNCWLMKS